MDNSCNQVRDISCNFALDISCNMNMIKVDLSNNTKATYCSTCNKLMPNTLICYNELCIYVQVIYFTD